MSWISSCLFIQHITDSLHLHTFVACLLFNLVCADVVTSWAIWVFEDLAAYSMLQRCRLMPSLLYQCLKWSEFSTADKYISICNVYKPKTIHHIIVFWRTGRTIYYISSRKKLRGIYVTLCLKPICSYWKHWQWRILFI